jgi:ATP-dependent DNA helicase, RecQ family
MEDACDCEGLGSGDPIAALAKERFKVDYLYPYQRLVVANVLEGPDEEGGRLRQIVLLPTGFGKSLCFQLPSLLLPGPTIALYPLLALMDDQVRRLRSLGLGCALFRGGQSPEERRAAESAIERGEAKIAITNPESLGSPRLLEFFKRVRPSHIAIDEAHCVSEWGESFRPAYLELRRILRELDPPATSAFTATASPTVFERVASLLFAGESYRLIEGDPDRPNISYSVVRSLCEEHSLLRLAREMPRPLIVFASSRDGVQMIARLLIEKLGDTEVRFYHAGLEKAEKKRIEDWFFASERGILVSTKAYGLGVDKRNIRSVVHFGAPESIEAYLQEAGRAGRDGLPSRAALVAGPKSAARLGLEKDELRRGRFAALLGYAESSSGCRRDMLLDLLGAERTGRPPCSGCDRCEGSAKESAEGEEEIVAFAKANRGRFTEEEALDLLRGSALVREPPRCAYWGAMAGWDEEDAREALAEAERRGLVKVGKGWFWKGRLWPGD